MNKNVLYLLIVLSLAGLGFYQYSRVATSPTPTSNTSTNSVVASTSTTSAARYLPFKKEELDVPTPARRVLFFYASWCPTCRPADADFQANQSQIPADVRVFRVNYNDPETDNDEKELAKKYGVVYQHTYVQIDQSGNVITQWNGGAVKELLANLK